MELTVYWTRFAENKLEDIFEYYNFIAGIRVAQTLINGIFDASLSLEKNPYIGQKENLFSDRVQDFRYLIFKNYKIIYWIDDVNKMILVSNVFDCRQDPEKLGWIKSWHSIAISGIKFS